MHPKLLKYLLDINSVISEIEYLKSIYNTFEKFKKDILAKRAVERHLEIIGEATNNIRKIEPEVKITGVKQIVNLRNLIIHSYDAVDSAIIWAIIQKDIPVLKREIQILLK